MAKPTDPPKQLEEVAFRNSVALAHSLSCSGVGVPLSTLKLQVRFKPVVNAGPQVNLRGLVPLENEVVTHRSCQAFIIQGVTRVGCEAQSSHEGPSKACLEVRISEGLLKTWLD